MLLLGGYNDSIIFMRKNTSSSVPGYFAFAACLIIAALFFSGSLSDNNEAAVSKALPTRPTDGRETNVKPSALIFTTHLLHSQSMSKICKDTTRCTARTTNTSGSDIYSADALQPYAFSEGRFGDILSYLSFSGKQQFTTAWGDVYGITGSSYKGSFDEKIKKGSMTRIQTGPKGSSKTEDVLFAPPYFRTDLSENVKGGDVSSNWTFITYDDNDTVNGNSGVWQTYSYTGDSTATLFVSGQVGKTYTVTLSVSATKWRLNNAQSSGPEFNPTVFVQDGEVPCRFISIRDESSNTDCKIEMSVMGGSQYDVTPKARGASRYTYTVSVLGIK